jgi:hypothetical protein
VVEAPVGQLCRVYSPLMARSMSYQRRLADALGSQGGQSSLRKAAHYLQRNHGDRATT